MTTPDVERWSTGRLLSTAARLIEQEWRERLRPLGLALPAVVVLDALATAGPVSQDELARIIRINPRLISPTLLRLELRGCIDPRSAQADRGTQIVAITESGVALLEESHSLERSVIDGLSLDAKALRDDLMAIVSEASQQPDHRR